MLKSYSTTNAEAFYVNAYNTSSSRNAILHLEHLLDCSIYQLFELINFIKLPLGSFEKHVMFCRRLNGDTSIF